MIHVGSGLSCRFVRTAREISSGGVVYRKRRGITKVALIRFGRRWCLPKGQVEEGEGLEETALREVSEETGLEGRIVAKIGDISYWFTGRTKEGEAAKIFKRVYFYLIRYLGGDLSRHDKEVTEVCWLPISAAVGQLSYPSEKETMRKAMALLKGQSLKSDRADLRRDRKS